MNFFLLECLQNNFLPRNLSHTFLEASISVFQGQLFSKGRSVTTRLQSRYHFFSQSRCHSLKKFPPCSKNIEIDVCELSHSWHLMEIVVQCSSVASCLKNAYNAPTNTALPIILIAWVTATTNNVVPKITVVMAGQNYASSANHYKGWLLIPWPQFSQIRLNGLFPIQFLTVMAYK